MSARSHLGFTVYRNHEQLEPYLARVEARQSPVEQVFPLDEEDRMTQFVARTLGDGKTLVRDDYTRSFGRPIERDFGPLLERLAAAGLVETAGPRSRSRRRASCSTTSSRSRSIRSARATGSAAREGRASFVRIAEATP
jgi:coproporphyrinogen III oxidase-like Fe-S oxidoreductase